MTYEDLLLVPFKEKGRTTEGMDCYGLVIECNRRNGIHLQDVVYEGSHVAGETLRNYTGSMNVRELPYPKKDCVIQCTFNNELHIGYLLDKKTCLHMTRQGVRVSPVTALRNVRFFEVEK